MNTEIEALVKEMKTLHRWIVALLVAIMGLILIVALGPRGKSFEVQGGTGEGGSSTVYVSGESEVPGAFRDYFTVEEAADLAGVSDRHMRDLCAEGQIPGAQKIDGTWRIPKTSAQ